MKNLLLVGYCLVLSGCSALPGIIFGPSGHDALKAVEEGIQAIHDKDPAQRRVDEKQALQDASKAAVEAGAEAAGVPLSLPKK